MALIKPGVWHSTVWASRTWQEDLWLEYGTEVTPSSRGYAEPRYVRRPPLPRDTFELLIRYLELKLGD